MQRILHTFFFTLSILMMITSSPALAAVSAEGAVQVKTILDKMIARNMDTLILKDGMGGELNVNPIKMDGETVVLPKGDYYEAKLPYITVNVMDSYTLDIGRIAMNIAPQGDDNRWLTTVALPKNMPLLDDTGSIAGGISFDEQTFKGLWDSKREIFIDYDARYKGLNVSGLTDFYFQKFSADELNFSQDLSQAVGTEDVYSGPVNFSAKNLVGESGFDTKSMKRVEVASVQGQSVYSEMPLLDMVEFQDDMMNYTNPADAMGWAIPNQLVKLLNYMPKSGSTEVTANDIRVTYNPGTDNQTRILTKSVHLKSTQDNLKSDAADFETIYNVEDISYEGYPESYLAYLPTRSQVQFNVTDLPLKSFVAAAQASVDQTAPSSRPMQNWPALMAEKGTRLTITNAETVAPELALLLNGVLNAEANTARGFTGDMALKVRGMDQALQSFQTIMNENLAMRLFMQQIMLGLTVLQSAGQLDDAGTTRTYNMDVLADGRVTLNGADISGFLNMLPF